MQHHFQVNLGGIIDLLSNHLYSGPEVFVRELLQNAVDAIRAREKQDPNFQGEITLELTRPRNGARSIAPTLTISENGIGLTEEEIHRFLATIGESSKRGLNGERLADFIGQFGIGLLSCFMVSDEIVVVTRSANGDHPALEWRGQCDGTYTLKKLDADLAAGTQVYLKCKMGCEEFFERPRLVELARHYGGLLPYPIRISGERVSEVVNAEPLPWRRTYASRQQQKAALLDYGREAFGERFFDAIPLKIEAGGVDGVAFILNASPLATAQQVHRVYLKNMFLSESDSNLLPPWAFFVRLVVNATTLKPTASREGFQDDAALATAREALGGCLRRYLIEMSADDPAKLAKLIDLHSLTIKALALADDEFYRVVFDWLPVETSQGDMTLGEYRARNEVLRYAPTMDQFRQMAQVAAAQQICVINGAYVYVSELLEKFGDVFAEGRAERIEPEDVIAKFGELSPEEESLAERFLRQAGIALRPFRCYGEMKKFAPAELPALYTTSAEGRFLRLVEQSQDVANPLWSSVLGSIAPQTSGSSPFSHLCFNFENRIVRSLCQVSCEDVLRRSIEMLYVQSLLLGHHPLSRKEMKLLNEGLLGLIGLALSAAGES